MITGICLFLFDDLRDRRGPSGGARHPHKHGVGTSLFATMTKHCAFTLTSDATGSSLFSPEPVLHSTNALIVILRSVYFSPERAVAERCIMVGDVPSLTLVVSGREER